MNTQLHHRPGRTHFERELRGDLIVVGGGMAGVCCAITAAREGLDVVLLQDGPVLGGNASSEVRMWIVGATEGVYSSAPPLRAFDPSQLVNGIARPVDAVNGWVPDPQDGAPWLRLSWPQPQTLKRIQLAFDTDFNYPMESVLKNHPESAMPSCVRSFRVTSGEGVLLANVADHHHTRWIFDLPEPVTTTAILVEIGSTWGGLPAIYEIRCY